MNNALLRREAVAGNSSAGVCCAWLSSPGNLWVQHPRGGGWGTVLPASSCGGMWRSSSGLRLVWSCWVCGAGLSQGCGSAQLFVHPKAPGEHPPALWPQHNSLKFLLQAMKSQEALEMHYSDDSGLAFVLLERKVENYQLLW